MVRVHQADTGASDASGASGASGPADHLGNQSAALRRPGALDVPSDQIQGPLHTRASVSPGSRCCCPFSTLLALLLTMTLPYVKSACPTRFFTHEDR